MAEEKCIEQKFKKVMEEAGWTALKLSCPGFDGMPDRMILKGNGELFFAEMKAPGKEPRKLQHERMKMLRGLGFRAYVVDSDEDINSVLVRERLQSRISARDRDWLKAGGRRS